MKTSEYRPLPFCLNNTYGFTETAVPPEGFAPPDALEIPPEFQEMLQFEIEGRANRIPMVPLFRSGTATYRDKTLAYRYYVPEDMKAGQKYPMVVFLHGAGERGDDNEAQLLGNDGAMVWVRDQREGDGEKCFVLAAQCPPKEYGWLEPHLLALSQAMDDLMEQYPIDENRLYLTGMSMGGGGCWRMNFLFPNRFAAVVPICPFCGMDETGKALAPEAVGLVADSFINKPLWMFHATDDSTVTVETSRSLMRALEERGKIRGEDFFYTEYPAELHYDHFCWNRAYQWKMMRRWLFQQTIAAQVLPFSMPGNGELPFQLPEGVELPFSMTDFAEMQRAEEQLRAARLSYMDRLTEGEASSPDATVPYLLYDPKAENPAPLVVMLHGLGGCGSGNRGQLLDNDGVIQWIRSQDEGKIEPCFVFAPHCPKPIPNTRWELEYLELVEQGIADVVKSHAIDPDRIYITGLSLGGYGVWNLNRLFPDKFAAVVSCCAACVEGTEFDNHLYSKGIEECAAALINKPLWMFHAEDDMIVTVETTRTMAKTLEAAGKTNLHTTIYPKELNYNHFCWDYAFNDPDMLAWLFEQKL